MTSIILAKLNALSLATVQPNQVLVLTLLASGLFLIKNEKNTDSLKSAINKPYQKFGDTS